MNVALNLPKSVLFKISSQKEVLPKEGSYIFSGEERNISVHMSKKHKPKSPYHWSEATLE